MGRLTRPKETKNLNEFIFLNFGKFDYPKFSSVLFAAVTKLFNLLSLQPLIFML